MIYVHVPFCRSFCTYCGFYSEICSRKETQQVQNCFFSAYTDAILDEIAARSEVMRASLDMEDISRRSGGGDRATLDNVRGRGSSLAMGGAERSEAVSDAVNRDARSITSPDTLYIGGGTPSVLPVEMLEKIVGALGPADYEEFTIEVNPDDIVGKGAEYVRRLVGMGVNRVSMGVQSFDDGILRWMNRRHDAAEAREAFRILREAGVSNISIDLIFGLSQLSDAQWDDTVAEALALGPEHISAYQLSVEDGSALARMVSEDRYCEASDEQCRSQYDILCRRLEDAGYRHYEVSNWAKPGREAVHNSAYWRRVSYVGLGPGAHSFDAEKEVRTWNSEELSSYDAGGNLHRWTSSREVLSAAEAAEEKVMLALRTAASLPYDELLQAVVLLGHSRDLPDHLLEEGSLVMEGRSVRIPEDRFFVSDGIITELI